RRSRDPTPGDRAPPASRRGYPPAGTQGRSPRAAAPGPAAGRRPRSPPRSTLSAGSAPRLDTCRDERRPSNTFLLGEVALRAIGPGEPPRRLTPVARARTVISDYAFLKWGARATDQSLPARAGPGPRHGAVLA